MQIRKVIAALSLTLFVFGLLVWLYIVVNSVVHPQTLPGQLTHLLPFPREDTAGEVGFVVSMVSFFVWNLVKDDASSPHRSDAKDRND